MSKIILSAVLSTIIVLSSYTPLEISDYKIRKVVIDAGHGGKDPGCHGKKTKEAQIALSTALELGRIIKENMPDVEVVYTRDKDVFVELHQRAKIANNEGADLFISLHCNSGPSSAYGTETFTMGLHKNEGNLEVAKKENSVIFQEDNYKEVYGDFDPNSDEQYILMNLMQGASNDRSIGLASKIEKDFSKRVGRKSRGVKQAGLFVLWKTTMPSVLVEIGFLTNPKEEEYLNSKNNRVYIASGIYRAFKEYKNELENN